MGAPIPDDRLSYQVRLDSGRAGVDLGTGKARASREEPVKEFTARLFLE